MLAYKVSVINPDFIMATPAAPKAIKLVFTSPDGKEDIRLIKLVPQEYSGLVDRVRSISTIANPVLRWKDEEGDFITVANTNDLIDADRTCGSKTLKLFATEGEVSAAPVQQQQADAESWDWEPIAQVSGGGDAQAQPTADPVAQPTADPVAQPTVDPVQEAAADAVEQPLEPVKVDAVQAEAQAVHGRVQCDQTGMFPVRGNRWHKIDSDYDLCEEAFQQLTEEVKSTFELIATPGAEPVPYTVVKAPATSADADVKPVATDATAATAVHDGVTCDRSGMLPIVGNRWRLVGQNFDLCEGEFNKLSVEQKQRFELIARPGDSPRPFGYPLNINGTRDLAQLHADVLRTVMVALQGKYAVQIDLTPLDESQHVTGEVRTEIPIDLTFDVNGNLQVGCNRPHGRRHGHHHGHGRHSHHRFHNSPHAGAFPATPVPIAAGDDGLPTEVLERGSSGAGVQQLQHMLIRLGCMDARVVSRREGFFGHETNRAVKIFQAQNGFHGQHVSGIVDAETREALLRADGTNAAAGNARTASLAQAAADAKAAVETFAAAEAVARAETEAVARAETEAVARAAQAQAQAQAQVVDATRKWHAELVVLESMGFVNEGVLVSILDRCNGHVDAVIAELLD